MAMDRQGGTIHFECDMCPESIDTGTNDFDAARAVLNRAEWFTRRIAGEWMHGCPKCGAPKP